jgi:hypothetical protein
MASSFPDLKILQMQALQTNHIPLQNLVLKVIKV